MAKTKKEFDETSGIRLRELNGNKLRHLFHDKEYTLEDIATMCCCSTTAVWKKMQRLGIDTTRGRFKNKPSDSLSYVLGSMLGDGTIYSNKDSGHYKLTLGTKSQEYIDKMKLHLENIGIHSIQMRHTVDGKDYVRIEAYSIKFVNWYNDLDYNDCRNIIKGHETGFLQGFWDAEGHSSVDKNGAYHVNMSNTDEWLLDIVKDIVKDLGFKFSIYVTDDGVTKCYSLNIRGGKNECIRFLSLVERDVK